MSKKEARLKPAFSETTPFRIRNSLIKTLSLRVERSNLFLDKLNYAFSYALKNQFEIMSCNESYDFNHNNFYHNGNNRMERLPRLLAKGTPTETKSRNDEFVICNNGLLFLEDELFSRNDYGEDFIFGFWNNFNYGFLFNRKINSTKKNFNQGEE